VTEGNGGSRKARPFLAREERRGRAWQFYVHAGQQTQTVIIGALRRNTHRFGDADRADVGGGGKNFRRRQDRPSGMEVIDGRRPDTDRTARIVLAVHGDRSGIQTGRDGEDLEHRTDFEKRRRSRG
jgi:hypothetical protein